MASAHPSSFRHPDEKVSKQDEKVTKLGGKVTKLSEARLTAKQQKVLEFCDEMPRTAPNDPNRKYITAHGNSN